MTINIIDSTLVVLALLNLPLALLSTRATDMRRRQPVRVSDRSHPTKMGRPRD